MYATFHPMKLFSSLTRMFHIKKANLRRPSPQTPIGALGGWVINIAFSLWETREADAHPVALYGSVTKGSQACE